MTPTLTVFAAVVLFVIIVFGFGTWERVRKHEASERRAKAEHVSNNWLAAQREMASAQRASFRDARRIAEHEASDRPDE